MTYSTLKPSTKPMKRGTIKPKAASVSGMLRTAVLKSAKPSLAAKPKMRKCTICKTPFQARSSLHKTCSTPCAISFVSQNRAKVERKELTARKLAIKPRAKWMAEAQAAVNAVVRERDRLDGCISCDKPATWNGQWHASHYLSVGAHPATRFDLSNIHKACSVCNNYLSGNIRAYRPRLIAKIGMEAVERLEGSHEPKKYTVDELRAITTEHKAKLKVLKESM
ncbi:MAG: hypothetical protein JWP38_3719 [Herbaspirillum sp.]|nr:hypothetical protein [Herbaspirillum sp.]